MTGPVQFAGPDGATPFDAEDLEGLIPTWVATGDDLNAAEQANIAKAFVWLASKSGSHSLEALMTEKMMKRLHKQMFGEVWGWAGKYRHHNTNIGTNWLYIQTELSDHLANVLVQIGNGDSLPWSLDELAIRFHHRLVLIHPFPNGNGRHSRLAADLLIEQLGQASFTWGTQDLSASGVARKVYLDALRHADKTDDFGPLVAFARS